MCGRNGWAFVALAVLLVGIVAAWRIAAMSRSTGGALGDGRDPESYGFDLSALDPAIDRSALTGAGFPRDGIPALVDPPSMAAGEVPPFNAAHRGKYLVPGDRVAGVVLGGQARAYPIRVLEWHEVANDVLGGEPIAVTYDPLSDSLVVFRRTVGDERLELRVSGLLHDSNLLLYDRRADPARASLWSQLLARAVAGPAAREGARLEIVEARIASWADWTARHPATTVLAPDERRLERYQRDPYGNYRLTGRPRFPVHPLPPPGVLPPMQPVLVVEDANGRRVVPVGPLPDRVGLVHAAWFAWYAHHPETALAELERAPGPS